MGESSAAPPGSNAPSVVDITDTGRSDDERGTEATRYLCAGAYLETGYRDAVLNEVLDQRLRAVAPSYGIDIVPVLRHCLRARRREIIRNAVLATVLVLVVFLSPPVAVIVVAVSAVVYGVRNVLAGLRALGRGKLGEGLGFILRGVIVFFAFSLLSAVPAAIAGLGLATLATKSDISVTSLEAAGSGSVGFGLLLLCVGWAAIAVERIASHRTLLDELSPGRFDPGAAPPEAPAHRDRIRFLERAQGGNVTFFARTAASRPYVGTGYLRAPWHLTIPLVPANRSGNGAANTLPAGSPAPGHRDGMTIDDLYTAMRVALAQLTHRDLPDGLRLRGLSLQERLFVPGLLAERSPLLEPDSRLPRHRIRHDEMRALAAAGRHRATQCLSARVTSWEGELEVSIFLYFSIRGNMLYIEFAGTSLPSINERFHDVDSYEKLTGAVHFRLTREALGSLPRLLVMSPVRLYREGRDRLLNTSDLKSQAREIEGRLAFDYGARSSVRELGAVQEVDQYFHGLDAQHYIDVVERRVVTVVGEVLGRFGYSAAEFLGRAATIIDQHNTFNSTNYNTANHEHITTNVSGGTFNGPVSMGGGTQSNFMGGGQSGAGTPAGTV
jgi:hypothetical protein